METTKLMPTLFYNGNYNREGHKMCSVFVKEISDGTDTFRLWRSAGNKEVEYPKDENDMYYLWIELHGVLATIGCTMRGLMDVSADNAALAQMFDGDFGKRVDYFLQLERQYGENSEQKKATLREEEALIEKLRHDPAVQTAYLRRCMDDRVRVWLKCKESGGESHPDFLGALVLDELPLCLELSAVHKRIQEEKRRQHHEEYLKNERQRVANGKIETAKQLFNAKEILRHGGTLRNDDVDIWGLGVEGDAISRSYSIILYLMREYKIKVPLRTQGWINERLDHVVISKEGTAASCRYHRTSKTQKGSTTVWDYLNKLIRAVREEAEENAVSKSENKSDM